MNRFQAKQMICRAAAARILSDREAIVGGVMKFYGHRTPKRRQHDIELLNRSIDDLAGELKRRARGSEEYNWRVLRVKRIGE